jgi:cytochrome c553
MDPQPYLRMIRKFLACAVLVAGPAMTQAQPAKPTASAELRPIFATVPDIIEGKRLAEVSCTRCHGANGISTAAGVPHIAAQRPPYIYTQLRAYLQGARPQSAMTGAVKFLSDDALVKVAAYYGTLDPARPAAAPKPAAKERAAQAIRSSPARRRRTCGGCHGDFGEQDAGTPSLPGSTSYIAAATSAQVGQRKDETMKALVAG